MDSKVILKEIKKTDPQFDVTLESVILDTYEVTPDPQTRSIDIRNCTFRKGLKISGVTKGARLFIENCTFEHHNGIKIENSCFMSVYIKNSSLIDSKDGELGLDILSRIVSQTVQVIDSYICNLFIQNININLEVLNSRIKSKLDYFPSGLAGDERSSAFFDNVVFESTAIRLGGTPLNEVKFNNINTDKNSSNRCNMLEIKQDFILDLVFHNANFTDTYIDLENIIIRNIKATASTLGSNLNFYIGNIKDEQDRKVNSIVINECSIGKSYFQGRIIHNSIEFDKTNFLTPPEFYNAEIPQGSIFPDSSYFKTSGSDSSISAFRALRLHMEEQRNRELEGEFFYLEQQSLLQKEKNNGQRNMFRYFYGAISDFGNNAFKPLFILLLSTLLFTVVYALWLSPKISIYLPIDFELLSKSLHFSTKQMTLPFWSVRNLTPLMGKEVLTHSIVYIAILQSLISLACIALSILAIRWRFKRG